MKEIQVPARRLAAFFAIAAGFAPTALAQQPGPHNLSSTAPAAPPPVAAPGSSFPFTNRASAAPPAAKYEDMASQRSFVLDRSTSGEPLMKFDDSPEVYALHVTTAQRGDDFLRTPDGQLMLRVTELGNVITYFSAKNGSPADIAGAASPLDAPAMPGSLSERVKDAAGKLGKLAGHDVTIFGAGEFARNEAWAADALTVTVLGVQHANGLSNTVAQSLRAVRLVRAASPTATFRDGELVLGVNPEAGYAGRPTSDAVAQAMTAKRAGL